MMDAMLEPYRHAFAPLIDLAVLRIVIGGADVGSHLAHHPRVSHVHITGSARTHDVVVFGTGADGVRRKAAGDPLLDKPIASWKCPAAVANSSTRPPGTRTHHSPALSAQHHL
ncbi:hypothetical protein ABLG96_12400 [Nakamurella sp. A5-74]|uniref:Uncharacterized protein n=1 Tax=Nakamurella sp. A5-74 TaxID=3158264 RepID=A0AAU8DJY0_9ACTN